MKQILPWYEHEGNSLTFKFDLENYKASREAAEVCTHFSPDDEDEQIDDVPTSCFNCMKRRWLKSGLECIQLQI
ncbi:hypothetical protein FM038_000725 [Shewanella eurypsychrophilus]|uniref:Uncharacterized protein n=1 Tax=Shewanella eurypsychrophilus TaxID=2593656 RepID=A0ABX6V0K3_9GAMM|nr:MULTISPECIES: hypothetical protein [Shewanella]QFU20542.1 hypothetical protein FS418_00715 [Shewanella sp. YLB-09]QFU20823.1 hypothetical protein FS418_02325 [Shewanella sp. YLB-09]QPG56113.1 hypothetical protein FM038_000725 [Shewanella eurypsychrophilus]